MLHHFTCSLFGRYVCASMNEQLKQCGTTAGKLDKLSWFAKNLEKLHIKPGHAGS